MCSRNSLIRAWQSATLDGELETLRTGLLFFAGDGYPLLAENLIGFEIVIVVGLLMESVGIVT